MIIPVTVVLNKVALVNAGVPGPLTRLQVPVPTTGLFPARVVEVTLQRFCAMPAFDVVGSAELTTVTVLVDAVQVPLEMLHWNT